MSGTLRLSDGAGRSFERVLEGDGSTEFYFDKAGEWTLDFGGVKKTVKVREKKVFVAPPLEGIRGSDGAAGSGGLTGWFSWGVSPEWVAVAFLLLALAGVAYYRFYYSAPRLRKSFDGKRVRVELSSGRRSLENVVLADYAPDEAGVAAFSEKASVSETVTGKVLKWRRDSLRAGEVWSVEYELGGAQGARLKRAEASADCGGKRVSLFS